MRLAALSLLCVVLVVFAAPSILAEEHPDFEKLKRGTVLIVVYQFGSIHSIGTGFIVSDRYVVTAAHVVEGAEQIKIINTFEGWETDARIVYLGDPHTCDVAILEMLGPPEHVTKLKLARSVREGEHIWVVGYPWQQVLMYQNFRNVDSRIVEGLVTDIITDDNPRLIATDAELDRGNSGGPAVNSKGSVVGIVSFAIVSNTSIASYNVLVHVNVIKSILDQLGIPYSIEILTPDVYWTLRHDVLWTVIDIAAVTAILMFVPIVVRRKRF